MFPQVLSLRHLKSNKMFYSPRFLRYSHKRSCIQSGFSCKIVPLLSRERGMSLFEYPMLSLFLRVESWKIKEKNVNVTWGQMLLKGFKYYLNFFFKSEFSPRLHQRPVPVTIRCKPSGSLNHPSMPLTLYARNVQALGSIYLNSLVSLPLNILSTPVMIESQVLEYSLKHSHYNATNNPHQ